MRAPLLCLITSLTIPCLPSLGCAPKASPLRETRHERAAAPAESPPRRLRFVELRRLRKIPRYTQGLVFSHGVLFESTGGLGQSALYRLDPRTGEETRLAALRPIQFGEGLAVLGDELLQLTWKSGTGWVYRLDDAVDAPRTVRPVRRLRYSGPGWGLASHNGNWIMSDGSSRLRIHRPEDFAAIGRLAVTVNGRPRDLINEMESIHGQVFANVYGLDEVIRIDPATGRVSGFADLRELYPQAERLRLSRPASRKPNERGELVAWDHVLNGIAFDPVSGEIYLTGKNWPFIAIGRFEE